MDFRRMQEFTVLAQAGSFRRAAQALEISPALLSSRINALEKQLGARLLERDAHRVTMTEAGKSFLRDAEELAADWRQLLDRIGSITYHTYRSIRVGMSGFTIPAKLGPYLDTVNLKHPDIHLELLDDSRHGIAAGLGSGALDIYFSYCTKDLRFDGIVKELVYTTRVLALVPQSHRLAYKSSISLRELDGERFVLYPVTAERAMHDCELSLLLRSGISFSVYEETICPSAYYIMAPVGKGLILCPWVLRDMIPPNTVPLSLEEPDCTMSMYMFYSEDSGNPYLPEFLEGFRSFALRGKTI